MWDTCKHGMYNVFAGCLKCAVETVNDAQLRARAQELAAYPGNLDEEDKLDKFCRDLLELNIGSEHLKVRKRLSVTDFPYSMFHELNLIVAEHILSPKEAAFKFYNCTRLGRKVLQRLEEMEMRKSEAEKAIVDGVWAVERDNQQIRINEIYHKLSDEEKELLIKCNLRGDIGDYGESGIKVKALYQQDLLSLKPGPAHSDIAFYRHIYILSDLGYAILDKMWEERYQFNRRKG